MKRFLTGTAWGLALLLVVTGTFFLWASSGRLSADDLAQTRSYESHLDVAHRDTLTVTTYNIGYLSGMTNNEPVVRSDSLLSANLEQALDLLRRAQPDIVGLQEIDFGAARSGYVHQLDTIGTRLGFHEAAQAVNWDERYLPFPYGRPAVHFGRTLSGQALLSRVPIRQHARSVLSRPDQFFVRDAFYLDRLAQVALIDLDGRALGVMNLHLEAFDGETRETQAREARVLYDRLVEHGLPVLVLGDLNSVLPAARSAVPARERRAFTDDETTEILLDDTNLRPVFPDSTYRGDDPPATFPADAPNQKIDHIFYPSDRMEPVAREIQCGAPAPPSDHCAVTATFRIVPSAENGPTVEDLPHLNRLLVK